jgi:Na+-translocating ferredoxin:NAD+ oxidoreductase subunit B
MSDPTAMLADCIDALLPQTQCTKCGYDGCRPYADAIAAMHADINQCPPGGTQGIVRLSQLTGRPVVPLNPVNGIEQPLRVAVIDERLCIGCTLCIQACPVDAIAGAPKVMHTVIAAECTGCRLCVLPCPVDCIELVESGEADSRERTLAVAARARRRYDARLRRLASAARPRKAVSGTPAERKRATIARAVARARERLAVKQG